FAGKPPLARHRAVYAAVGEMMQTDIHALSIEALAPGESG
ncbi:cell division protein BolA, partial [Xanthomonas vasicola]